MGSPSLKIQSIESYKPERSWEFDSGVGTLFIARFSPTLVVVRSAGDARDDFLPTLQQGLPAALEGTGISVYWDAGDLERFSSDFRSKAVDIVMARRKDIASFEVLVHSPLIMMAASAVNLLLGGFLKIGRERPPFEESLRRRLALERFGR